MSLKITSTFGSTNVSGKEQIHKRFEKKGSQLASFAPRHQTPPWRIASLWIHSLPFACVLPNVSLLAGYWCTSWTNKSWILLGTIKINCFSFKRSFKSHALKQSQKAGNFEMDFRIGLIREYVTDHAQNSPPNVDMAIFCQTFIALMSFSRGYSFYLDCFRNWLMINLHFALSRWGLVVIFARLMSSCITAI